MQKGESVAYFYDVINKQEYVLQYKAEIIEMLLYTAVAFFLPVFLGHPQLVVGVVVNAMLVTAALNVKGYKLLPVIIAPVLGVLSRGVLFGPFTVFLLYMVPFIWLGNFILVFAFKELNLHRKMNAWLALLAGSAVKALFLFGAAFLLVSLGVIPALFLTTMGLFQFYTAILGGILALGVHAAKKKWAAPAAE
jgi:hypothetical protein